MALIKCPECSKEISERAKICPHCGYSIEESTDNIVVKNFTELDEIKNNVIKIKEVISDNEPSLENEKSREQTQRINLLINECAELLSKYKNYIAKNRLIHSEEFVELNDDISRTINSLINLMEGKDYVVDLAKLADKSSIICAKYIENNCDVLKKLEIDKQKQIIEKLDPDHIPILLKELGYFPLIDLIDINKAKDILYRLSTEERHPIILKMKNPPEELKKSLSWSGRLDSNIPIANNDLSFKKDKTKHKRKKLAIIILLILVGLVILTLLITK
jgi:hypothetical protein